MDTLAMKARGFTLIELMIVITILGVLLTIAAPSFSRFIATQRIKAASFDLQSALMLARSEAIKRGPAATITVEANSSDWSKGWIVWSGVSGTMPKLSEAGAFERIAFSETGSNRTTVTYSGDGRVQALNSTAPPYAFSISSDAGVTPSCVRIDPSGMPFSKTVPGGAC